MNISALSLFKPLNLFHTIKRYKIIIPLLCLMGAVLFCCGAKLLVPAEYQSSITVYANTPYAATGIATEDKEATAPDTDLASRMLDTYVVILQSRSTLQSVIDRGQLNYSYDDLAAKINTATVKSTEALEITVTDRDPYKARYIANLIAEVLPAQVAAVISDTQIKVVDYAEVTEKANKINYFPWALAGIIAGFILGCVLGIFILPYRQKITNAGVLKKKYHLPVLAAIPDLASPAGPGDKGLVHPASGTYYVLASNIINILQDDKTCNVLGITSPENREDKTTTIANLCYTLAQLGNNVLTIESELDNAGLTKQMKLNPSPGIAGFIKETAGRKAKDYIINSGIHDNWDILPAGEDCEDKLGFFGKDYLGTIIAEADCIYDYVIIDLPPACTKDINIAFNRCTDGILMVIRKKQTTCKNLEAALKIIHDSNAELKGTILTRA